jgi:hypothetical protein
MTHDSGTDGDYLVEKDRIAVGLAALRASTKWVSVGNGGVSHAKHVTKLPFKQLSDKARTADTFTDFPHLLMSVGKTANDARFLFSQKMALRCTSKKMSSSRAKEYQFLVSVRDARLQTPVELRSV